MRSYSSYFTKVITLNTQIYIKQINLHFDDPMSQQHVTYLLSSYKYNLAPSLGYRKQLVHICILRLQVSKSQTYFSSHFSQDSFHQLWLWLLDGMLGDGSSFTSPQLASSYFQGQYSAHIHHSTIRKEDPKEKKASRHRSMSSQLSAQAAPSPQCICANSLNICEPLP